MQNPNDSRSNPLSKLTKFVNDYFFYSQSSCLRQQQMESLELYSDETQVSVGELYLLSLKTLACPPQFLNTRYNVTRLRLDFKNSREKCEIDVLGYLLSRNLTRHMKSLAIFLNQSQSRFDEIMSVIDDSHEYITHLEIHQFLPTQVKKKLPLPVGSYGRNIETLVFRPPPGNRNLCAYVELRTQMGRRKVAEKLILRTLHSLTRLVLVVYGNNYEFQRSLYGVITGENLVTRDTREWTWVK